MTFDPNAPFESVSPEFDPNLAFTVQGGPIPQPPPKPEVEELPSLFDVTEGLTERQKIRIAGAMIATPNERAIGDVVKVAVPGAEISEDESGNVIVQFPQGAAS